jgi:hypothetical protein
MILQALLTRQPEVTLAVGTISRLVVTVPLEIGAAVKSLGAALEGQFHLLH